MKLRSLFHGYKEIQKQNTSKTAKLQFIFTVTLLQKTWALPLTGKLIFFRAKTNLKNRLFGNREVHIWLPLPFTYS